MPNADLILKNANVITVDPKQPTAQLVATRGDRIMAVTSNERLGEVKGSGTRVIDCQGKTVVPGFNDAHCHIFSAVRKLLSLDLSPSSVRSIGDIKASLHRQAQAAPPGEWLSGTDYNDFYLAEKRHPTRYDIDEVAPDHPVVLCHRSLHTCVLNSLALSLAGITRETPDPAGGLIDREPGTGEPTGILFEMLGHIREKVMPPLTKEELARGVTLTNQQCSSHGITSLQDATIVNNFSRWQMLRWLKDTGKLKSRVLMMFGIEALNQFQEEGLVPGSGDSQLRLGGVKIILTEFADQIYPSQTELNEQVFNAHRAGFQVAIHAVAPSTIEAAVIALEYACNRLPHADRRHRIEHCSRCPSELLKRLACLPIVVVTQPATLYYSGERHLATIPASQLPWLFPMRSFINHSLVVAGSSDYPVISNDPLVGIYAAVTRRLESGQQFLPQQCVSAGQALAMYTANAAYASFEEDIKGSITPGKLADMVVLSDDPIKSDPEKLKDIRVEMTIIGGEVVWED